MPDLTTDPTAVTDPGMDEATETEAFPARRRRTRTGPVQTRAAVDKALSLLGKTTAATAARGARPVLPSARARSAIEMLARFETVDAFDAAQAVPGQQLDRKAMCRDLFDWGLPVGQPSRATKATGKAVLDVLHARANDGRSLYCQGVEMLSFAAAASPLLPADRLLRLIASAPTASTAFAPERYTMQLSAALQQVLRPFQEARREQLLLSLWRSAHDGRWWDMTSGLVRVRTGPGRRSGGADEDEQLRRQAADQTVRELLSGVAEDSDEAREAVLDALLSGRLPFNDGTSRLVAALPPSQRLRELVRQVTDLMRAGKDIDPDIALHASHLPWLTVTERPETPLTWLVKTLLAAITPDPETGEVQIEALPEKPKEFSDLYPLAELAGFPYPVVVHNLDKTPLPGTTAGQALVELVHNPAELAENRDFMGNCTWSKKSQMESGGYVLLKVWRGPECFNAALNHHPGGWTLGEINSRHNRGNVPDDIRAGVDTLASSLPAPGPLAEVSKHRKRTIRYAVS